MKKKKISYWKRYSSAFIGGVFFVVLFGGVYLLGYQPDAQARMAYQDMELALQTIIEGGDNASTMAWNVNGEKFGIHKASYLSKEIRSKKNLRYFTDRLDKYLRNQGFKVSVENTGTGQNWFQTDMVTKGYEKDSLKCTVGWRDDSYSGAITHVFSFFCGQLTEYDQLVHNEFKAVTQTQPYLASSAYWVDKWQDDWAVLRYVSMGSSIVRKIDNNWTIVIDMYELLDCEDVERLEIPRAIYGECMDYPDYPAYEQ